MRKGLFYILSCFIFCLFTATTCCEGETYEIDIVSVYNNTEDTVYICFDTPEIGTPDLTPYELFTRFPSKLTKKQPFAVYEEMHVCYNGLERDLTYQIIIFKQSTIDKYTKEELMEQEIFDKRYIFTYDDLKAMDYKVVYTGEESYPEEP